MSSESPEIDVEKIVADIREKIRERKKAVTEQSLARPGEFREDEYVLFYPDVAAAIAAGKFRSGHDHWLRKGRAEGRVGRKPGQAPRHIANAPELLREIRMATARLEEQAVLIGVPPPGPATLRSRLGAVAMNAISKLLWWYTHPIREFVTLSNARNAAVNRLLEQLVRDQAHDPHKLP